MIRSINSQTIEWSTLAKAGNLLSCEISKYLLKVANGTAIFIPKAVSCFWRKLSSMN